MRRALVATGARRGNTRCLALNPKPSTPSKFKGLGLTKYLVRFSPKSWKALG